MKTTLDQIKHGDDDGSTCSNMNSLTLRRGKNRSFVIAEVYSDREGCAGQLNRDFLINIGPSGLEVTALHVNSFSYSAGDPSPVFDLRVDLRNHNAKSESYDEHDRFNKGAVSHERVRLPAACGPVNVAAFGGDALPACLKTALKKLYLDCGRQDHMAACPSRVED